MEDLRFTDETDEKEPSRETITTETELTPEEIEEWWGVYDAEFEALNKSNPCRQSFNKKEFEEAMQDESVLKFVCREEGEIVSMCIFGTDLRLFPWISEEYYKDQYPESVENGNFLYFMALLTKEEYRRHNHASEMIQYMLHEWEEHDNDDTVISFDCCTDNNSFLPDMVAGAINATGVGRVELEEQGTQHYYAGKVDFPKS